MDKQLKTIDIDEFKSQIQKILEECRQNQNFDINIFVGLASQIKQQINNTPNAYSMCKVIIIQIQKCLLEIYAQKFKDKPNIDEFFTILIEYQTAAKHLNLACYHVCQNLSQKETFCFWKIAVGKIVQDNIQYIQQGIFKQLQSLLGQIYKKQEQEFAHKRQESEKQSKKLDDNSIIKFQNHNKILLELSQNEILIQRDINVFDAFCQLLFKFIESEYQQKYQRWHQVYSVKDYLIFVERELQLNEELFSSLKEYVQFKGHYTKILRFVYENQLLPYKNVVLKDEKGFLGLLNQFLQSQDYQDREIAREEIIQILRVFSKFQDKDIYFNDFKQNFQIFVRKAIEEQYKEQTLHHELEKQKQKYQSLVKILCDIYDKFQNLIIQCFREYNNYYGRYDLEMIVKEELHVFFIYLEQSIHLTLQLCDYAHDLIIQMSKTDDQQQIEENQDEIRRVQHCLLPFIKDYDYYLMINYYRLASRLLGYLFFFEKSHVIIHLENEKKIIDQMKQFCGDKKLKKFYKMISETADLTLSTPISTFDGISSEIIQINKKKWPILYDNDQNVFQYFNHHKEEYHRIHNQQYTIAFSDTISYVEIYWIEVKKTLMINCVQAAILFLYDKNEDPKSLKEITESIKLEKHQVKFQLDRMVKQKILWNDEENYYLNNSQIEQEIDAELIVMDHNIYENERYINEFKPVNDKTQDFKYQLDAYLMKILKVEKRIFHTNLFEKVNQHFYPTLVTNDQLKTSIEFLSKYEYIIRDPTNQSAYLYQ